MHLSEKASPTEMANYNRLNTRTDTWAQLAALNLDIKRFVQCKAMPSLPLFFCSENMVTLH